MKYAIIALAGRQFVVKEGDILEVTHQEKLVCKVLFYKNESEVKVGTPYLENVLVDLEKLEDKKGKKVTVARFRAKSRHRRKVGHRQPISIIRVKSIGGGAGSVGKVVKETGGVKGVEKGVKVVKKRTVKKVVKKEEVK